MTELQPRTINADQGITKEPWSEGISLDKYNSEKHHDRVRAGLAFCLFGMLAGTFATVMWHAESVHYERYMQVLQIMAPAVFGYLGYYASSQKK